MKICFVVEDIYPTLHPSKDMIYPNGRAIHCKNLGKGLLGRGHEVSYITMDYGQSDVERINDFVIFKMYKPDEGLPGIRFFLTRMPKLIKALKEADADVYLFKCPDPSVGVISRFCKKSKKKFIYYGASDNDFTIPKRIRSLKSMRDTFLFKMGIDNADLVICQNSYQLKTLNRNYGREGEVLYNFMDSAQQTYNPHGNIIWISNYRSVKRPAIFIELSKKIDDKFLMIGGKSSECTEREYQRINSMATNSNIEIMGRLGYEETDKILSQAKVLVNTSEFEGFSNLFLQAWRRGIPVVSFVDPDDLIKKNNLGRVVADFDELVDAVEATRKGISEEESKRIKDFFDKTFSSDVIIPKLDEMLKQL